MAITVLNSTGATVSVNTINDIIGSAGTPATNVQTIQGIVGGVAIGVSVSAALPAGTAIIGKVGIDQTTPGTTNLVSIGSNGTITLLAGSAIIGKVSIDQTTPGTTNKVDIGTNGTVAINAALPAGTNLIGNIINIPSATVANPTTSRIKSAASTNATSVKGSAGAVYYISASNNTTAAKYLKFYDKATAPTVGTDVPIFTVLLPALGGYSENFVIPIPFSLGVAYAITGGLSDADTTATAVDDVQGIITYK